MRLRRNWMCIRLFASAACLPIVTACSFPPPAPKTGQIQSIQVNGVFGVGGPITVSAGVLFWGAYDGANLVVMLPEAQTNVVRIGASAWPAQHFLGLGIFPVDTRSQNHTDLTTDISLAQPGTYVVEGIDLDTQTVTATSTPFTLDAPYYSN